MTESGDIHLGQTNLRISALGIGAWQWGDRFFWGYGQSYTDADLQAAFAETLNAGINFIDTAELYGPWTSERKLGEFIRTSATREKVVVATKFFPFPWRLRRGDLVRALRQSLKRLGLPQVDLYQTHRPSPPVPVETWMEAMADAVGDGLTRSVGVSNYSADQMKRSHDTLARRGIPLASNQVEYSLLNRLPERNGVLATCRELSVTLIAYSPIAKGILSGKYTPGRLPPGLRAMRYNREYLARVQPLIGLVKEIGEAHGKTPSQVALNWLICKGAVPIPGAKNVRQAQENAGALGWRLSESEIAALDKASDSVNSEQ
ncbi:MAG: aldo/keto reductase [Chloroflexota bacterium]